MWGASCGSLCDTTKPSCGTRGANVPQHTHTETVEPRAAFPVTVSDKGVFENVAAPVMVVPPVTVTASPTAAPPADTTRGPFTENRDVVSTWVHARTKRWVHSQCKEHGRGEAECEQMRVELPYHTLRIVFMSCCNSRRFAVPVPVP